MKRQALKCPECDRRYLQPAITELTGTTRGEAFAIPSDALLCPNCGFKTIPVEKMGEFALRVSDAYREKYHLLTSSQMQDRRLGLGMSQQQFADYLGVGSSSVKRWELGQIQDQAMNNLMILKTDLDAARENVIEVSTRLKQASLGTRTTMGAFGRAVSRKDKYAVRRTK
ncbi:MAG TPA: type II TA system antitoxin MqsA family protein [Bryobacteraceae bacterium]|nr:type II TA system antitoxin MqsA family protein [Bryobacteraceae bacterium]